MRLQIYLSPLRADLSSVYGIVMLQTLELVTDSITSYGFDALYWGEPLPSENAYSGIDLFSVTDNLIALFGALSMLWITLYEIV
jgi:hypothetical protein